MQPLVILHISKTEELCAKMREVAETKTRKTAVRTSRVVEVMETTNLPQLHKEWTVEDPHKAKKMIACMIYKYVRDVMFNEMTAMHVIVDKFKVKQTTIHRQLYGKKYPGGGQTLEQMKACTTTQPVNPSKTRVKKKDTAKKDEAKQVKAREKAINPKSREPQKKFEKKVHQRGKSKKPRNEKLRRQWQWKKKMKTDQRRRR